MSATDNLVLSILKNIQTDISAMKADIRDLKAESGEMKEQMNAVSLYITYTVGLHSENTAKIENIEKNRLDLIEKRLDTLEARG